MSQEKQFHSPKAILIDLDGTIADTLSALYRVYMHFLEIYGIKGSSKEFEEINGLSIREGVELLKIRYQIPKESVQLHQDYLTLLRDGIKEDVEMFPGVREFLEYAESQKLDLAIVTSASDHYANTFVNKHHIYQFFKAIITPREYENSKPDPTVYLRALEVLKISAEHALAIEDSVNGMKASLTAGIPTLFFSKTKNTPLSHPLLIGRASSWQEILQIVKEKRLNALSDL